MKNKLYSFLAPSVFVVSLTLNAGAAIAAPPAPLNLQLTNSFANEIDLSWNAPPGAAGYRVYVDGSFYMRTTSTSIAVIGLRSAAIATAHAFSVDAFDASNSFSPQTAPMTASTLASRLIQVGPARTYKSPGALSLADRNSGWTLVKNGDTIEIDAGTYTDDAAVAAWHASNLTLRGVGGRPHLDANARSIDSRGVTAIYGKNTVVENIEFSGGHDSPGAGIRLDSSGGGLVVRNCYFHDNDDGILGGNRATDILIENSEFYNNGDGSGQTHNLYVTARAFVFRNNYSHGASIGHLLKSRSLENYILYNRFSDEPTGSASAEVELPCGGLSYVIGNLMEKGLLADSGDMVRYAAEQNNLANCPVAQTQELYVVNNAMVNDYGPTIRFIRGYQTAPLLWAKNNLFVGQGAAINWPTGGAVVQANNSTANPLLADQPNYDYRLTAGSPAIDQGVNPGIAEGFDLTPTLQYVHPASSQPRPASGPLDIGAYEYSGPPGAAPFDFSVMNSGAGLSANPGGIPVTATLIALRTSGNATPQPVTFSASTAGPISNVLTSLSANQCTPNPTCSTTVTATVPTGTPYNTDYSVFVNATSGGLTKSLSVPLSIYNPAPPPAGSGYTIFDYIVSASPGSLTLTRGASASATIIANLIGSNAVPPNNISASGLPSGVSATFSPSTCASAACTWTMTLSANANATPTPLPATVIVAVRHSGTWPPTDKTTVLSLSVNTGNPPPNITPPGVAGSLSSARVYPNPWRSDQHRGYPITFDQFTGNITLKIFTVSGHLVKTLSSSTGSIPWDLTNNSGDAVASGMYLYLLTNDQGGRARGKLTVIR